MKKKFTFLIAALALLSFLTIPTGMSGQTKDATTIASWNNQALTANVAVSANAGDTNNSGIAKMTSSKDLHTAGTYCYYNSSGGSTVITFTDLTLTNYSDITLTFYSRGSQQGSIAASYSNDGNTFLDLSTISSITKSEKQYTISSVPNTATALKLTYGATTGSFYFGTPVFSGTSGGSQPSSHNVTVTGASHGTVGGFTNPVTYNTVVTLTYTHYDGEYYSASFSTSDATIYGPDMNKFIMPDHNVTITVTETPLPVYTVTYSDGGSATESHYGAGVTLPTRSGNTMYTFAGWTTSKIASETTTTPDPILTGTYYPTANITLYPVYTRSELGGTVWQKITDFSTVTDGTYTLITNGGKAFNGTITSGRGGVTENAFEFSNNEALSAPEGTCELTLTAVDGGFTIKNSSNKFLYIKAASEGNLDWKDSETSYWYDYVSNSVHYLRYKANNAYLRSYNEATFRTYSGVSNAAVFLVKKTTSTTNYYVSTLSSLAAPSFAPGSQNFSDASLTVTITANEGCVISYTIDGTDPETSATATTTNSNSTTVTVTSTTTIRALAFDGNSFSVEASQTYTKVYNVALSSNGVVGTPVEVVSGQSTTLNAPSNIPNGYSFRGWTATPTSSSTFVNSTYTPSNNITLYAVFGKNTYGDFEKVTLSQEDYSGNYLIVYNNNYALNTHYGNVNADTYGTYTDISSYHSVVNNVNTITYNETTAGLIVVVAKTDNGYSLFDTDGYLGDKSSSTGSSLRWDTEFTAQQDEWTLGVGNIVNVKNKSNAIRWNNNTNQYRFAIYGTTGQQAIMLYKLKVISTDGYYIRVFQNETATAAMEIVGPSIIPSGSMLDMGNYMLDNSDPANLIIEDGGQLYTNDVVVATIKKSIQAYTIYENNATDPNNVVYSNGWHFISSPLNGEVDPANDNTHDQYVANLIASAADYYDLYELVDPKWENYKSHTDDFKLYTGHGYLYANRNDVTLEFVGSLNYLPDDVSLENGWNLVGNPYAYNAYPSMNYYKMNAAGTEVEATEYTTATAVPPCTGILVENPDGTIPEITFSKNAPNPDPNQNAVNHGNVQMVLTQTATTRGESNVETLDKAIVSFNKGSQLGKFYFGSQNANICIPQGNKEYAIVNAEGHGEVPVNFVARKNGEYTLNINAEEVEMNYLHLIDHLTGADVDLLATPSYTFNARTSDYASRFKLVFAAHNTNGNENDDNFAFICDGQIILTEQGDAQVFDVMGRMISSHNSVNHITTEGMAAGVYVIRLTNGSDVKTQKIIVK